MAVRFQISRSAGLQVAVVYAVLFAVFPSTRNIGFLLVCGLPLWLVSFQIAIDLVYWIVEAGLWLANGVFGRDRV